ncbi:MAG: type I restriction enzyme HsdR N-terminal domain-containing protein [Bacteroidales bacterium]|nr:type I restriction enzyme HsdR N-terminal domain-containing protein [Bacteroidales bacterium]
MAQVWDPLRRKEVAATPEEQVRQWFIAQLRDRCGVPLGLMMSEAPLRFGAKSFRADILVYDRQAAPLAVVECKRPDVPLDEAVIRQAMRYDIVLGVCWIVLTNGKTTYMYKREGARFEAVDHLPDYEEMLACRQ